MSYPTPHVIDVSGHQDPGIDWDAAREAGVEAVIVKQTEGSTHESPTWLAHAKEAKAAGLKVGGYHFAWPNRPVEKDAEREAGELVENFCQLEAAGIELDLWPVLDLEKGKKRISSVELVRWADIFADVVCSLLGIEKIIVYANHSYVRTLNKGVRKLGQDPGLGHHLLWKAGDDPDIEQGIWTRPVLWQTPQRRVDWYDGKIDCNVLLGDLDTLLMPHARPESSGALARLIELEHEDRLVLEEATVLRRSLAGTVRGLDRIIESQGRQSQLTARLRDELKGAP